MSDEPEVRAKIRAFLSRSLRNRALRDDEDLHALGLVHSLFVMQIVLFIEKTFEIELDLSEVSRAELSSVERIAELVLAERMRRVA